MKLTELQLQTPYLDLDEEFYDLSKPQALDNPYLIHINQELTKQMGLDIKSDDSNLLDFLNGTFTPTGSKPYSMCYAGHQFGNYIPRLGDGRAHNLGSINGWNLQLKGSGETIYANSADGRCSLSSSIREYLMGEAMYYLGIPTTRALGIVGSQEKILRDGFVNSAIVMRASTSWIRFGTFEYFYYFKEYEKLEQLAEYVIEESYPELIDDEDRFFKMFCKVVENSAKLIASWQGIGFCHGVMNTDNMSVAGVTLDYGPFSMLDDFEYGFVSNKKDKAGRYAYGEQPNILYWNLTKLAKALSPLIEQQRMDKKLEEFGESLYPNIYIDVMRKKLGLKEKLDEDKELIVELIGMLQDAYVDHTLFFRTLSRYDGVRDNLFDIAMNPIVVDEWLNLYDKRLEKEIISQQQREQLMLKINPKYILKNYMLEKATTFAKQGDFTIVEQMLYIAQHPFEELPECEEYAGDTPEGYKNITLSCSS
jgi:uncharacterized protein YdiU (UPF0061 family)